MFDNRANYSFNLLKLSCKEIKNTCNYRKTYDIEYGYNCKLKL